MIRDAIQEDRDIFLAMSNDFYSSDAVDHPVDVKNFEMTFRSIMNGSHFARLLTIVDDDKKMVGYGLISLTYSNEVGGLVVLLEELFLDESCRGKGYGSEYFGFLEREYPEAKRFRLEVTKVNTSAIALYERLGYEVLEYVQMIKDFS